MTALLLGRPGAAALSQPHARGAASGAQCSTSYARAGHVVPLACQARGAPQPGGGTRRSLLSQLALGGAVGGRSGLRAAVAESAQLELSSFSFSSFQESGPKCHVGPLVHVQATGRIIAIGDIHGDLNKALACLELAGVLASDAEGRVQWTGGDTTVVQLGDVLDRGDSEIATILLLRELDMLARKEGGAVWMLNGNHESLNVAGDFRYVTPGAFWESAAAAGLSEEVILSDDQAVLQARWSLYRPGGEMARELARNPTVLVVNDIVFAHGGLLPHHVKYGLQRINDEVAEWMLGVRGADGEVAAPPFPAMGDSNSVMWNRTFGKERVGEYDRIHMGMQLNAALVALNAQAMVVGHTPQMGGVNCECNGRVWRVDAGLSAGVLDAVPQVLEFSRDAEGRLVARLLSMDSRASTASYVYALPQQQAEVEEQQQQPQMAAGA